MILLHLYLASILIVWIFIGMDVWRGLTTLTSIEEHSNTPIERPLLSVVIPARNEEGTITDSVLSQLKQDYHPVEWILVNDRSTDGTPEKLDALGEKDERISVLHVHFLEPGWLGKNQALYKGCELAKGDLILFTDADVIFKDSTILSRAVSYLQIRKLDHLTLAPHIRSGSFWLKSFVAFFLFGFTFYKRPWKANDPDSKTGMGIGAFNLITRSAYEEIGTHEGIKHMPDDDLQLGVQLKKHGKRQFFLTALESLEVEWYRSLNEAFNGLEKNTFAGLHYSLLLVLFAILGVFSSTVLPFITVLSSDPGIRIMSVLIILFIGITYVNVIKRMTRESPLLFLALPVTSLLFIYSIGRAIFLTFKRGGIEWRGTLYTFKELKRKRR
ncbi:glycosyltransferase [Rossellomorea sp. AcN35-11]|nr:glycosyltransferase family 2 protein [Rossellomorea aquimaris]NMH68722.1 glycosyltransferase [Bacillus sp. RO3]WJV28126.1 glycosyltransferase [Rossellomorea sp. AcN35-11]